MKRGFEGTKWEDWPGNVPIWNLLARRLTFGSARKLFSLASLRNAHIRFFSINPRPENHFQITGKMTLEKPLRNDGQTDVGNGWMLIITAATPPDLNGEKMMKSMISGIFFIPSENLARTERAFAGEWRMVAKVFRRASAPQTLSFFRSSAAPVASSILAHWTFQLFLFHSFSRRQVSERKYFWEPQTTAKGQGHAFAKEA